MHTGRVAAPVGRDLCFSENRSLGRAKPRGIRVPFTEWAANHQPELATRTLQFPFEERSDEHDVLTNTARPGSSAGSSAGDTHRRGGLLGRGDAPFAWNGRGWWWSKASARRELHVRMIPSCHMCAGRRRLPVRAGAEFRGLFRTRGGCQAADSATGTRCARAVRARRCACA